MPDAGPCGRALLEVDNVTIQFGGVTALDEVTFDIKEGEILGLIGPNGAGKTTCFNVMTGVYQATSGQIRFDGTPLAKRKRHEITKLGIARTFQNIRLFKSMTALENVMVGADAHSKVGLLDALFRTPLHRRTEAAAGEGRGRAARRSSGSPATPTSSPRTSPTATSGASRSPAPWPPKPKLLCLDEPAAGFNPAEKERLMELIRKVRDQGYTVLLIEHDMRLVMGVTDRIVVLEFGRKIAEGPPAEIRDNPAVIAAYLGVDDEDAS